MDIFNHPWQLFFAGILSIVSSWYCWIGFRDKNIPNCLFGIGLGVPTLGITEFRMWAIGAGFCAGGWWLRREYDL